MKKQINNSKKTEVIKPEVTKETVSKTVTKTAPVNSNWNKIKEKIKNKNSAYQKKKETKAKLKSATPYTSTKVEEVITYIKDFDELCNKYEIEPIELNSDLVVPSDKELSKINESSSFFSIDCKIIQIEGTNKSALGKICICNQNGEIVYERISKPMEKIIDCRGKFTGLTKDIVNKQGAEFLEIQKQVEKIIRNKIIIGHDLTYDLKALKLVHKKKLLRDATQFPTFFNPETNSEDSLKSIVKRELLFSPDKWDISGKRDTVLNVILYKKYKKEWEAFINNKFYGNKINNNSK
ncbi:hypothetical protein DICPUDRAFT_159911 [Dictyostelium purpureum]|uniref:Exonuclease domain-containing protein n=1 Tax=Dictyostelium purpureum TaxID=5786 RepID=F1A595_DICPU|nr:uncharacterized protein DICPUDRAFT_159911 [Dictyostelium purpureum]EGC28635.1 hypothetical protein DICPUDRAFT_159911 [Dictyostelium purpureum]|eukprot:XP_003294840.1 hypothetical protein DICPUDRAFT_159911 [Dictyostelium purpureum]